MYGMPAVRLNRKLDARSVENSDVIPREGGKVMAPTAAVFCGGNVATLKKFAGIL